jgi:hypothetical protein
MFLIIGCVLIFVLYLVLIIILATHNATEPKYFLSIMATFKNENHILQEWIEHYIAEGATHFYLIDNESTDDFMITLQPFIDENMVTLFHESGRNQHGNYNKNVFPLAKESSYILTVDLDEFVYSRLEFDTISSYLRSLNRNDISDIHIPWKMFGSNGHIQQPPSVIKGFTRRSPDKHILVKSIVNTSKLIEFGIHTHEMMKDHETIVNPKHLNLNHYAIQSWSFFEKIKMTRGDAMGSDAVRDVQYFKNYDHNDILDTELKEKNRTKG